MKLKLPFSLSEMLTRAAAKHKHRYPTEAEKALLKMREIKQLASAETKLSVQNSLRQIEAKERQITEDEVFVEDFLSALRPLVQEESHAGPPTSSKCYH